MCDCGIGIVEEVFKKTCARGGAWVDADGICVDAKRSKEECGDCKFWRDNARTIKIK